MENEEKSGIAIEDNPELWEDLRQSVVDMLSEELNKNRNNPEKINQIKQVYDRMRDTHIVPINQLRNVTIRQATDLTGLEKCANCKSIAICTDADLSTMVPMAKVSRVEMMAGRGLDYLAEKFPNVEELSIVQGYEEGANGEMMPQNLEGSITPMAVEIAQDYVDSALANNIAQLQNEFGPIMAKYFDSFRFDGSDPPEKVALLRSMLIKQKLANIYLEGAIAPALKKLKRLKKLNIDIVNYIQNLDLNQFDNFNLGVQLGENIPNLPLVFDNNFMAVEHSFELLDKIKFGDKDTKLTPLQFVKELNQCTDEEREQLIEYINENDFTQFGPEFVGVGNAKEMMEMYLDIKNLTDRLCTTDMDTSARVNVMYQWVLSNMEFDADPQNPSDVKGAFDSGKANMEGVRDILNLMLASQNVDLGVVRMKDLSPKNLNDDQNKDLSYHLAVGVKFFDNPNYFQPQNDMKANTVLGNEQLLMLMQNKLIPSMQVANLSVQDRVVISKYYQNYLLQKCQNNGKYLNNAQVKEDELGGDKTL